MARTRKPDASRDDMRAVMRLARSLAAEPDASVSIKRMARRQLNWLKSHHFKVDSQSMVINLACLHFTGSLTPWKDADA